MHRLSKLRFRFSLRFLCLVMLAASLLLGGFAWRRERARQQLAAIRTIERLGGMAQYKPPAEHDPTIRVYGDHPKLAEWQERWLGPEFFFDIVEVSQSAGSPYIHRTPDFMFEPQAPPPPPDPDPTEENVVAFWQALSRFKQLEQLSVYGRWNGFGQPRRYLGQFTRMRDLRLYDAGLRDDDLAGLEKLPRLVHADFQRSPVGDATADRLGRCSALQGVNLAGTQITDAGLKALARCTQLDWLHVGSPQITDEGVYAIRGLSRLKYLKLEGEHLGKKGFVSLAGMPELISITLSPTSIDDEALAHFADLENLESLDLESNRFTGTGLRYLKDLPKLETLWLSDCPLTGEGLQAIAELPQLKNLKLDRTPITAEAFAAVRWPETLEELSVDKTAFDDAALENLQNLPNLKHVGLLWTQVTREAHDRFHAQRPGVLAWLPNDKP